MKVTSKKDDYIVKCKNIKESNYIMSYLNHNCNVWFYWEYIVNYNSIHHIFDEIPEKHLHLPVISFKEWLSLPDYKPEEVAFKREKIIGYKLVKPEYKEAVRGILKNGGWGDWFDSCFEPNISKFGYNFEFCSNNIGVKSHVCGVLKESGVLDLWFEPVYYKEQTEEEKFIGFVSQFGFKPSEEEARKIIEFFK